jgi:hypothetical protein
VLVGVFRGKAENGALKGGGYIGGRLRHTELVYEPSYNFPCNSYLKLALGIVKIKWRLTIKTFAGMAAFERSGKIGSKMIELHNKYVVKCSRSF